MVFLGQGDSAPLAWTWNLSADAPLLVTVHEVPLTFRSPLGEPRGASAHAGTTAAAHAGAAFDWRLRTEARHALYASFVHGVARGEGSDAVIGPGYDERNLGRYDVLAGAAGEWTFAAEHVGTEPRLSLLAFDLPSA